MELEGTLRGFVLGIWALRVPSCSLPSEACKVPDLRMMQQLTQLEQELEEPDVALWCRTVGLDSRRVSRGAYPITGGFPCFGFPLLVAPKGEHRLCVGPLGSMQLV